MAKISNKRLHECIVKMMELEDRLLEEEMKHAEPHVFSAEFERKMEEVMRVQTRVCKHSDVVRYLASAAVVILMVFGLLFIGNEDLRASDFKINVLEWMEEFFVVENDTNRDKDDENDVLFHESQIGYIPEGFEKVEEYTSFSMVFFRYEDDFDNTLIFQVFREKSMFNMDNKEVKQDVVLNQAGHEYRCVYKEETNELILTWVDNDKKFYVLSGTVELEALVSCMNSISY